MPLFKIITALGIYDTEMALIITMVTQTLPTAVFMLKSYFDTIPDEIEEAAMMDGLNRLQIIFRITVPLAMSGRISVSSTALWWRGTTICLRRSSSPAPAISPYRWA